jgi:hypothetical protein
LKTRYFALPAIFGLVASLLLPFQPPATLSSQGSQSMSTASASEPTFTVAEESPSSTVTGRVVGSDVVTGGPAVGQQWDQRDLGDESENKYIQIFLERAEGDGYFNFVDLLPYDIEGEFNYTLTEIGEFRVRIVPFGYAEYAMTTSPTFTVNALGTEIELAAITVRPPDLRVVLRAVGASTDLVGGEIELLDSSDRQVGWFQPNPDNSFNLVFPANGEYQLIAYPSSQNYSATAAKRLYQLNFQNGVMTYGALDKISENGVETFVGYTPAKTGGDTSLDIILLGQANLAGRVVSPTGEVIPDSRVAAFYEEGRQVWKLAVNTDEEGRWAMALPPGTYTLTAEKPRERPELGDSIELGPFTVGDDGSVTMPGQSDFNFLNIDLALRVSTWSGTVVEPGTSTLMSEVQVCFVPRNDSPQWICSYTGDDGRWGIAAPADFTGFDETASLQIEPRAGSAFATKRVAGVDALTVLLGSYEVGTIYSGITLSPAIVNLRVQVMLPVGQAEVAGPDVWVGIERSVGGYLGGATTSQAGIAAFFIDNPAAGFTVSVNVDHIPSLSSRYSSTRTEFSIAEVGVPVNGVYTVVVFLAKPNFFGIGVAPDSEAQPLRDLWIELFDPETYEWLGGVITNPDGRFNLNVPVPSSGKATYELTVNPPWNSADFARKSYALEIDDGGRITVFDGIARVLADIEDELKVFKLSVGAPSVIGVVRDADGNAVRDSWVTPMQDTGLGYLEYLWQSGANTNRNGRFAMSLKDGNYLIEAEPSWNNAAGLSRSAKCQIRVENGAVVTRSSCVDANGGVNLSLRGPNLKFKLVDRASTPAPVAYAHVGVGVGNWFGWAQSNRSGDVSIFIDEAEIAAANPGMTGSQPIRFWVDPPWGRSDIANEAIVRWDCESGDATRPLCGSVPNVTIGQAFTSTILGNVQFPGPNVSLSVRYPDGTAADEAWVSIFLEGLNGNREWLGGGNANSAGLAAFNIPTALIDAAKEVDSAIRFAIEVNPGWRDRSGFSTKLYTTRTFAQVDGETFALEIPNLDLTLLQPTGTSPARWAWVGVEKLDGNPLNPVEWLGGTGLDSRGKGALTLPDSTKLKLTFFPGPGGGAQTECLVQTDEDGVLTAIGAGCAGGVITAAAGPNRNGITMTLGSGNVTGRVFDAIDSNLGVAGAIVYAERAGVIRQTVTDSNGNFGLQLDAGDVAWIIKVFVVARPEDSVAWQSRVDTLNETTRTSDDALSVVVGGASLTQNIGMVRQ